ncbi:MAG TPA: glycosyltransferase [Candidatus Dojkabacteria bacterium]|nr:glycosyltransferase [Candidatus Dojkabacteria bacterium]
MPVIPQNIKNVLKQYKRFVLPNIVRNQYKTKFSKNVLLVYITNPFNRYSKADYYSHTNRIKVQIMAKAFKRMRFNVDVIDFSDVEAAKRIVSKKYDVIFGLGNAFEYLVRHKNNHSKYIYFATGMEASFQNSQELNQLEHIKKHWGITLKPVRISTEDHSFLANVDGLIVLGNKFTADSYKKYFKKKPYIIKSVIYEDLSFFPKNKDWDKAKYHFYFQSGTGFVMSGLDQLLEIFDQHNDWYLHIAGKFTKEMDLYNAFRRYLTRKNVILEGWVDKSSEDYLKRIVVQCGAVIKPVLSAGIPGDVIDPMNNGLIPLVSKEANMDVSKFGYIFKSHEKHDIEKAMSDFLNHDTKWYEQTSKKAFNYIQKYYSEKAFSESFMNILKEIL